MITQFNISKIDLSIMHAWYHLLDNADPGKGLSPCTPDVPPTNCVCPYPRSWLHILHPAFSSSSLSRLSHPISVSPSSFLLQQIFRLHTFSKHSVWKNHSLFLFVFTYSIPERSPSWGRISPQPWQRTVFCRFIAIFFCLSVILPPPGSYGSAPLMIP